VRLPNTRRTVLFALAVSTFGGRAGACSLVDWAFDLRAFLARATPGQVVFVGKVREVNGVEPTRWQVSAQHIKFDVSKWWRGEPRETIEASAALSKRTGSSCDGLDDFSARVGEEWLIVGYEIDGIIRPNRQMSKLAVAGHLPEESMRALETFSFGSQY
jgi:hypothetical protein